MSDEKNQQGANEQGNAQTPVKPRREPQKTPPRMLPPWRVILHNDDVNEMEEVIRIVRQLTTLTPQEAMARTVEANESGAALLLVTHRERAELYVEQFATMSLTATCEPDA